MDNLGWQPIYSLDKGIQKTVKWFELNRENIREK